MLYNIHEVKAACVYNCPPHLVAVVLGKEQAECLASDLNLEHEDFHFVATPRSLNEGMTHWVDASFDFRSK